MSKLSKIVYLTCALMIAYYGVFFIYPVGSSIVGSFAEWNPLSGEFNIIGLDNYIKMKNDPIFLNSLYNTVYFSILVVIGKVVIGFLIAIGLYSIKKYQNTLRTFYFLPVIMPMVAVSLIWNWMYDPRLGLINMILASFGIVGKNWLTDPNLAMDSVIVMTVWKDVGYAVLIFLAGLLNVPTTILEAAKIDGASYNYTVRKIMIPLVKPTLVFVLITSVISYFQTFTQIFIMTEGGPGTTTTVLPYLIYSNAFKYFDFGYASALSTTLFIIIIIITFIQMKVINGGESNDKE